MTIKIIREIIKTQLFLEQLTGLSSDDFKDVYATARMAHMGQTRRDGGEYFSHPSEVRNILRRFYPKDYISQMAALLHDSLEDAPGLSVDSVEEMEGFIRGSISSPEAGDEVLRVVRAVTHEKGGDYSSYVLSLLGDEKSLRVKLSDMVHNLSDNPSPKQKEKYRKALDLLSSETQGSPPVGISQKHWDQLYSLVENNSHLRGYNMKRNQMKIAKRQLRRIIKEERAKLLREGNHAVDYARGYEDAMDSLPKESRDPWYSAGYDDYLNGIHDQYSALVQDGVADPNRLKEGEGANMIKSGDYGGSESGEGAKMVKSESRAIKKLIKSMVSEGTLYVQKTPYGVSVEDDDDDWITIGEMVLALFESGDEDIFQAPQGVDPKALAKLKSKHEEGVQGGMQRWDNDVFENYYNVDSDRVIRLFARLMNHNIKNVPYDEGY